MKFRSLATAAASLALVGSVAVAAPVAAEPAGPTLTDLLQAQGGGTDRDWYDFDILAAGVEAAGLSAALDDPNADLTVFLPNDRPRAVRFRAPVDPCQVDRGPPASASRRRVAVCATVVIAL